MTSMLLALIKSPLPDQEKNKRKRSGLKNPPSIWKGIKNAENVRLSGILRYLGRYSDSYKPRTIAFFKIRQCITSFHFTGVVFFLLLLHFVHFRVIIVCSLSRLRYLNCDSRDNLDTFSDITGLVSEINDSNWRMLVFKWSLKNN